MHDHVFCSISIPLYAVAHGQDDLRQDAVMQQVFTIMNMLLHENKETSKRKLLIRTYKVSIHFLGSCFTRVEQVTGIF
uniref:PI3K/PI4K catalytic domain-containing protein n=1 Tax=Timema bartmani TaxID=61472 RepID=A0A7R9IAC9_9NEOP|nr:unnamed protein product [Timema bartmani]